MPQKNTPASKGFPATTAHLTSEDSNPLANSSRLSIALFTYGTGEKYAFFHSYIQSLYAYSQYLYQTII